MTAVAVALAAPMVPGAASAVASPKSSGAEHVEFAPSLNSAVRLQCTKAKAPAGTGQKVPKSDKALEGADLITGVMVAQLLPFIKFAAPELISSLDTPTQATADASAPAVSPISYPSCDGQREPEKAKQTTEVGAQKTVAGSAEIKSAHLYSETGAAHLSIVTEFAQLSGLSLEIVGESSGTIAVNRIRLPGQSQHTQPHAVAMNSAALLANGLSAQISKLASPAHDWNPATLKIRTSEITPDVTAPNPNMPSAEQKAEPSPSRSSKSEDALPSLQLSSPELATRDVTGSAPLETTRPTTATEVKVVSGKSAPQPPATQTGTPSHESESANDKRIDPADRTAKLERAQPVPVLEVRSDAPAVHAAPVLISSDLRSDSNARRTELMQNASPQQKLESAPLLESNEPVPKMAAPALQTFSERNSIELHFNVRTEAFGRVDVHTTLHDGQVGLSLGSEHGSLREVVTREVGTLESGLRQHDLHLDGIHFLGPGTDAGMTFGNGRQDGNARAARWNLSTHATSEIETTTSEPSPLLQETTDRNHAVSIHA